jgi:hypothetical protein
MAKVAESLVKTNQEQPDLDLQQHLQELARYELHTSEWQHKPALDNPKHDFVTDLVDNYLKDIEKR